MDTDVTTAQTFDAGSFLSNILNTAGNVYVASRTAPTQNTGQPAASTRPTLTAAPNGNTTVAVPGSGMSQQTMLLLAAAAAIGLVLVLRKS